MTKKIIKMRKRLNLQKVYEEGEVKVKEHDHIAKKISRICTARL